jgi:hypothetical protein
MANHLLGRFRVANKIALLLVGIAPLTVRVPVPSFDHKFGILTVGHCLPSGVEDLVQERVCQQVLGRASLQPINSGTQRVDWTERICQVGRDGVHDNRLCGSSIRRTCGEQDNPDPETYCEYSPFYVHNCFSSESHRNKSRMLSMPAKIKALSADELGAEAD